jgi:hypothetical protein
MTVAALDAELVDAESPKGPIRIKPVFTAAGGHSQSQLKARALVAVGLNDFPAIPGSPALSSPAFELTPAGLTRFTVTGGANCTVDTQDHGIALVIDPNIPNAHGGKLSVTTDPQEFVLQAGMTLENTLIVVQRKGKQPSPFGFDSAFASVLVSRALPKREVTIAFNFVDGQNLVQTKCSDDSSLDAVINSLNEIYEPQTHITFRRAPGSRFRVTGLASQDPKVGVVFAKGRRTDDWNKITSHRTGALLNVFSWARCPWTILSSRIPRSRYRRCSEPRTSSGGTSARRTICGETLSKSRLLTNAAIASGLSTTRQTGASCGRPGPAKPFLIRTPRA